MRLSGRISALLLGSSLSFGILVAHVVLKPRERDQKVERIVAAFAPGVKLGARASEMRDGVAGMTYVPHLGYVADPASHRSFPWDIRFNQLRLLADTRTRALPGPPDPTQVRIDAIEAVSTNFWAPSWADKAFTEVFNGAAPVVGCIRTDIDPGLRDVRVWTSSDEAEGVALITDRRRATVAEQRRVPVTSIIAFQGKFQGGRTLRANYTDSTCAQIAVWR